MDRDTLMQYKFMDTPELVNNANSHGRNPNEYLNNVNWLFNHNLLDNGS